MACLHATPRVRYVYDCYKTHCGINKSTAVFEIVELLGHFTSSRLIKAIKVAESMHTFTFIILQYVSKRRTIRTYDVNNLLDSEAECDSQSFRFVQYWSF